MFTENIKIMNEYRLEKKLQDLSKRDKIETEHVNEFPCRMEPRRD